MSSPASPPAGLSGLIEAIYATVVDAALWPDVLRRIGEAVTGTQALLFLSDPDGSSRALRCQDTPDEVLYPFLQHYSSVNVLSAPCDRMFQDGTARYSHLALPDAVFERSEFYQDFFRKQDLYYSLGIKDHSSTGALTYLSVQRPWKLSAFSETDGQVLTLLLPHIRQALALQKRLQVESTQRQTAEHALMAFGRTVIGVNEQCEIDYVNEAAEQVLRDGGVLYEAKGKLHAKDRTANERLQASLRTALAFGSHVTQGQQEALLIHDPKGASDMQVVITPQRVSLPPFGTTVRAVVSISRSGDASGPRSAILGSLYQLTATECRVADLLLAGQDAKEIADTLSLTLATTRFYVKRVLHKTGTRKQSQLIRFMLDLPSASNVDFSVL